MPIFTTQQAAYLWMVQAVQIRGKEAIPRGLTTREIDEPIHVTIENPDRSFPLSGTTRDFRNAITAGEGLSLVGQTSVPETILDSVKAFRPFLDGSIFWGAYGPRVAGDLVNLVELLDNDHDTRQAVLSIYDADRDLGRTKMADIPCTVAIQFRRRGSNLDMWVMMRSNDVWLGTPYDFGQFTMLQAAVAQALLLDVGRYHHSAGSLHLYAKHDEVAHKIKADEANILQINPIWRINLEVDTALERLAEISSRSRRILIGQAVPHPTYFERWLGRLLGNDA